MLVYSLSQSLLVSFAAVIRVVTQREALRDDSNNGCGGGDHTVLVCVCDEIIFSIKRTAGLKTEKSYNKPDRKEMDEAK